MKPKTTETLLQMMRAEEAKRLESVYRAKLDDMAKQIQALELKLKATHLQRTQKAAMRALTAKLSRSSNRGN